ncbi:amidase [Streptomyces olivoverticillatus]
MTEQQQQQHVQQQSQAPRGLAEQALALARGDVTSRALVEDALRRIADTQPTLNAFRRVRAEAALREADEADRLLAAGERGRPLLGVPLAVKDDMDVAGEPTAFGCAGDFPPQHADSEAVRRLRAAGAVIVGKTNTPELGQWPVTDGPAFGITRNPWSLEHTPGGSSGGSAAAVAAGLVPAALGSDGAGSIRIPAAWTHLVGIKPQRGRVSTAPAREAFRGLTADGPLARTVADAALLLHAVAGSHRGDLHRPPPVDLLAAARREPRRLRIALSFRPAFAAVRHRLDPVVRDATVRMAERLESLGHEVVEEEPRYGLIGLSFVPRSMAGVREWTRRTPDRALLDPPYARQRARRPALRRRGAARGPRRGGAAAAPGGGAVRPVRPGAHPPRPPVRRCASGELTGLGSRETNERMIAACPYAWPWNVLGWPGVSVPSGFTASGLPLGAQFLGPAGSEPLLVSLAAQVEAAERWYERWPEG